MFKIFRKRKELPVDSSAITSKHEEDPSIAPKHVKHIEENDDSKILKDTKQRFKVNSITTSKHIEDSKTSKHIEDPKPSKHNEDSKLPKYNEENDEDPKTSKHNEDSKVMSEHGDDLSSSYMHEKTSVDITLKPSTSSTYSKQQRTTDAEPSTYSKQQRTTDAEPSIYSKQQRITEAEPSIYSKQQRITEAEPSIYSKQQRITEAESSTYSKQQRATDVESSMSFIRLDANQYDPTFLSPMSNDDFTCDSILRKSSSTDDNYQYDDGLPELLSDMRKCIAYDQLNDRYFIKRITETGQPTVMVINSRNAKDRLTKYMVRYCTKDSPKILEKNLYTVIDKYAITGGFAYENEVFHDIRLKNNPNVLNVFYKWKYSSLPKDEKIDMDLIKPFFDLCENNIFNHREEYCVQLYSWIAYILQCPGHRNNYGYIISGKPGTGKTTLINFIADLTDGYSIANVDDIGSVFGTFNSSREFKVFIGINDLYCSDSKFTWNMLKTPVTEDKFERRQQYETTRTAQNVNNIMITANSEFFNVEDFDRRWQCIKTVYDPKTYDRKYFAKMYDMLRNEKAMRHLYTFFIRLCLDEYEPGIIIPDSLSTENGYVRFIKQYRRQYENTKFTMVHLNTFWGEKSNGCEGELLEMDVLKCGEPLKAIYSQFVDWAIREGIQRKDIPDEKIFESDIKEYEDITLDNYFRIKSKSIKFKVIHFKKL